MMGNVVANVCAKFNYDLLRIDKVLGNWKSNGNNSDNNNNKSRRRTFVAVGTHFGSKNSPHLENR